MMHYIVRWNEDSIVDSDCVEWEAIDNAPTEDDAYDLMEAYSNKYPHARIDIMDAQEYNDYISKLPHLSY